MRLSREVGERGGERVFRGARRRRDRRDEQNRGAAQPRGHELQQQQRVGVRPVQIVEHQHERFARGEAYQQLLDALEQAEARLLALTAAPSRPIRAGPP